MRLWELPGNLSEIAVISSVTADDCYRFLHAREQEMAESFLSERRRSEWKAARVAAKVLALRAGLTTTPEALELASDSGRPHFPERDAVFVSLSHSHGVGAAAVSLSPIGIDVEAIRPIDPRTTRFYLQPHEEKMALDLHVEDVLMHLWSAKEAAWKSSSPAQGTTLKQTIFTELARTANGLRASYESGSTRGTVESFLIGSHVLAVARFSR